MSWFDKAIHSVSEGLVRSFGHQVSANHSSLSSYEAAKPVGPMQKVLDQLRGYGRPVTLDMLIEGATQQNPPISPIQMANLTDMDLRGVTFTQTGMDRLRDMTGIDDLKLDLRGSNIAGSVFRPASSFDGVVIDEVTVGKSTNMQHLTFDGITQQTNIHIQGDMSFFQVIGNEFDPNKSPDSPVHAKIEVESGARAIGASIAGSHLARLHAHQGAFLNGLDASDAKALYVDADGVNMSGANFTRTVFAPGSKINKSHLVNVNFEGATLGDMDLSGSRLVGANFRGADLTYVNFKDAEIDPAALIGAHYQAHTGERVEISSDREATAFMKYKGMQHVGNDVMQEVLRVKDQTMQIRQQAQAGRQQLPTTEVSAGRGDMGAVAASSIGSDEGYKAETQDTDNLINALMEVNKALMDGSVKRTLGGDQEEDLVKRAARQQAIDKGRNQHEEEWRRAREHPDNA